MLLAMLMSTWDCIHEIDSSRLPIDRNSFSFDLEIA
jgi:hypothetical protein